MTNQEPIVHQGIPVRSVCFPKIPVNDPRFIWTSGADVQSVWRRYGWTPIEELREKALHD